MITDFCIKCGSKEDLHAHHLEAKVLGGKDEQENLISLCSNCHASLHGRHLNINHRELTMRGFDFRMRSDLLEVVTCLHRLYLDLDEENNAFNGFMPASHSSKLLKFLKNLNKTKAYKKHIDWVVTEAGEEFKPFVVPESIFKRRITRLTEILENGDRCYYSWWLFWYEDGEKYRECPVLKMVERGEL